MTAIPDAVHPESLGEFPFVEKGKVGRGVGETEGDCFVDEGGFREFGRSDSLHVTRLLEVPEGGSGSLLEEEGVFGVDGGVWVVALPTDGGGGGNGGWGGASYEEGEQGGEVIAGVVTELAAKTDEFVAIGLVGGIERHQGNEFSFVPEADIMGEGHCSFEVIGFKELGFGLFVG